MKKFIVMVIALTLSLSAGLFSTAQGLIMDEKKPTHEYTIDTNGINPRVYEFTTKSDKNQICVYVVLSGSSSKQAAATVLQCFKKQK